MGNYIIVGDTKEYTGCLIYVCGTQSNAENVLSQIKAQSTEEYRRTFKKYRNLRIEYVKPEDCWWKHTLD